MRAEVKRFDLQCGPRATLGAGNVCKVADNEATVVRGIAHQAHTIAANAIGIQDGVAIDTNVDLASLDLVEAFRLGLRLRHIVDVPVCRVADLVRRLVSVLWSRTNLSCRTGDIHSGR